MKKRCQPCSDRSRPASAFFLLPSAFCLCNDAPVDAQLETHNLKLATQNSPVPLLEINNLKLDFLSGDASLRAVDDVSLTINAGETVCLVGESGCGKSVTALSIARLVPTPPARYAGGEILLNGRDVLKMSKSELRETRGGVVSYVFQEPGVSLNPVIRVGKQIKESLKLHKPLTPSLSPGGGEGARRTGQGEHDLRRPSRFRRTAKALDAEVIRLLKLVRIPAPESRIKDYPFQMSGGMQQRVMIAMALASQPKLLVADEPTTALDVTIQAQILELLHDLKQQLGMSILLITHNLGIVGDMADRVAVMYAGQLAELAPARELLRRPLHPYTRALIASVPELSADAKRLSAIPGNVPSHLGGRDFPPGCRFAPRCTIARPECAKSMPDLVEVEPERWVRCPFWNQVAI
jgi:oligopeptide/dipeptide ABC transporter ATP-binding protein